MGTSRLSGKPDEMLGGYLQWTSIPSRTPSHFMLQKPQRKVIRYFFAFVKSSKAFDVFTQIYKKGLTKMFEEKVNKCF